jgi:tetratricopeptide (TPR) repeat protein
MPEPSRSDQHRRALRLLSRGANLLQAGKAREALPPLERAHQLEPDSVPVAINLAGAYILLGRHSEAIPLLEAASQVEPDNPMIWTNLGAAYLGNPILATSEQQVRAIAAFQTALDANPAAPNVHYNLGLIFLRRDEVEAALAAFRGALTVNPFDRDAEHYVKTLSGEADGQDDPDKLA